VGAKFLNTDECEVLEYRNKEFPFSELGNKSRLRQGEQTANYLEFIVLPHDGLQHERRQTRQELGQFALLQLVNVAMQRGRFGAALLNVTTAYVSKQEKQKTNASSKHANADADTDTYNRRYQSGRQVTV
jgi:hypothetical protein